MVFPVTSQIAVLCTGEFALVKTNASLYFHTTVLWELIWLFAISISISLSLYIYISLPTSLPSSLSLPSPLSLPLYLSFSISSSLHSPPLQTENEGYMYQRVLTEVFVLNNIHHHTKCQYDILSYRFINCFKKLHSLL